MRTWREKLSAVTPGVIAFQGDGFVPMRPDQMQEQLPAAPLVFAAYAIAWVGVLVYVLMMWRRLGRVERELAEVQARIKTGAKG